MSLNRYERSRIVNQLDGYMVPSQSAPLETRDQQFRRAKIELIKNLEFHLAQVRSFELSDFTKKIT